MSRLWGLSAQRSEKHGCGGRDAVGFDITGLAKRNLLRSINKKDDAHNYGGPGAHMPDLGR